MGVRELSAWVVGGVAFALLLASVLASFFGGGSFAAAGVPISVTSWKVLRVLAPIAALALWLHPRRAELWERCCARVRPHAGVVLGVLLGAAVAWLAGFKVLQHLSFRTGAYDLSMFHHAVHNTLHGELLHAFGIERNFLSEHTSPILLALVPLYALWPSPLLLLVAQAVAVALACVPLFKLARHHRLPAGLAALVPAIFLFNEHTWRAFAFDFHVELFAPLFVFSAALAFAKRQWWAFYGALALMFSVKEDMSLVGLAFAGWIVVHDRRAWRHAVATAALSIAWAIIAWKFIIPLAYPDGPRESHFVERYAHLGTSYTAIAVSLLSRPGFVLERIFSAPMGDLLLSLGGLPLLHPASVVLALPTVLLHLVSGYEAQVRLGSYYGLNALLLMMVGVPAALARLKAWTRTRIAAAAAIAALVLGAGAPFAKPPVAEDARGRALALQLPVEQGVSAQHAFLPHLPPSKRTRLFPRVEGAAVVILDVKRDVWPLTVAEYRAQVQQLLADPGWGVEQIVDQRFIVLRRNAPRGRVDEALIALNR